MLKQGIISFFEYLLMLMIILEFNTPYIYFPLIKNLVNFFIIISALVLLLFHWRNLSLEIFAFAFLLLIGAIFPFMHVYEGRITSYIKIYFIIFPLLFLLLASYITSQGLDINRLMSKFSNIVFSIAVISISFWLFGSILGYVESTAVIPNSWGGDHFIPTYYGLYFETQEATASEGIGILVRNSGIFNEGPMYNMILCTSLAYEIFLNGTTRLFKIVTIVIAILTTVSTTGFIFLLLLFSVKGYMALSSKYGLQMVLLFPVILFLGIVAISTVLDNKKEKGEGSYNSRSRDITKCIEVGIEHPVTGVGIFFNSEENSSDNRSFGYSNSLFGTFAHGGFYFLFLYLIPLFVMPIFVFFKNGDSQFLMMLLSFFLLFSFTVSQYRVLTVFMLSYSLSYWYMTTFTAQSECRLQTGQSCDYGKVN